MSRLRTHNNRAKGRERKIIRRWLNQVGYIVAPALISGLFPPSRPWFLLTHKKAP